MLGAKNGGFFAGAIGGLLLALLLVGTVSYLPQHNAALQATAPSQQHAGGASAADKAVPTISGPAATSTTVAAVATVTTTAAGPTVTSAAAGGIVTTNAAGQTVTVSGGQASSAAPAATSSTASRTSAAPPAAATKTPTTILSTTTNQVTATQAPNGAPSSSNIGLPYSTSGAINGTQARGPNSLLTNLPGQTVGGLLSTISPLLVGLLVAALIYSAYLRRQDSA